jgi:regulator of RNase E activity RraB
LRNCPGEIIWCTQIVNEIRLNAEEFRGQNECLQTNRTKMQLRKR